MKSAKPNRIRRKPYRPSIPDRQENRSTFVRFPEYTLLSMVFFKTK